MAGSARGPSTARRPGLERRAFLDLLKMANRLADPKDIARQLAVLARHLSGCEAVGVRLQSGPGFPYAANLGFPPGFTDREDNLCASDEQGRLLRDERRKPILACFCGQVLTGQVDRAQPHFTDRGSFISASLGASLAAVTALPVPGGLRGQCRMAGFETVGLFPIRRDDVTYGLIQCSDHRPGRLTPEAIDLMENLAASAAHLFQLAMG